MAVSEHVRFDFRALYDALNHYRLARGAPWAQIAAETLVSRSTLVGTANAGPMEADGILIMVRLLERTFEDFTTRSAASPYEAPAAADPLPPTFRRLDTRAVHAALNEQRRARGLTWREVAAEIGTSTNVLTGLARGGRTGVPTIVWIAAWLDRPVEDLTHEAAF
jgi:hypothetical protein